jgi:4'-phosphopantetheinyl transferase
MPTPVRVWVATLAAADLASRAWLDARERERLGRYQADADRARFLLGAAMLRSAVGLELGVRPQDVTVDRACETCGGWHGRPVVPGTRLALSVSHGGLLVVLALALDAPVGVDVERVDGRHLAAVRRWTSAEARFKAGGAASLTVHELPAPLTGHVLALATAPGLAVRLMPTDGLLSHDDEDQPGPGFRSAR